MNNYEDRTMNHKRVRMDGEGGPGVVQGNGIPLSYMDNGHQIPYQPYAGSYNAHYPPADVTFGAYGGGGDLAGYAAAARGLAYAPPAHQGYPQQPAVNFSLQQQQQQIMHMPYEQQRPPHPAPLPSHSHRTAWPPQPQPLMQPLQANNDQAMKSAEMKVKQEIKVEPAPDVACPPAATMRATEVRAIVDNDQALHGSQLNEDPPKIKIKTDLFKENEAANLARRGVITDSSDIDKITPALGAAKADSEEHRTIGITSVPVTKPDIPTDAEIDSAANRHVLPNSCETGSDLSKVVAETATPNTGNTAEGPGESDVDLLGLGLGLPEGEGDIEAEGEGKSRISDSGNSTDSTNKNKFQGSEDETKIPNEIYFGTPDISTYRPKPSTTPSGTASGTASAVAASPSSTPARPDTALTPSSVASNLSASSTGLEVKKRGRPKGSVNKPKPPEMLAAGSAGIKSSSLVSTPGGIPRPTVGRPRGGGHSSSFMSHAIRPFKRDFSGIRFRRRWSDDGLDSTHIPNEVYFGDVPVTMEVLYNFYDSHAEREKIQAQQKALAQQNSGNVTLVYSSSDSSSDDSSDSDSSDSDPNQDPALKKRRPGRPRGSKTVNRRSDGPRLSSTGSQGERQAGITDMKKFLKIAGIEYDYVKLIDGCTSNKERVARLLKLLTDKGLEGEPTVESCRALYSGPPPRRRGPKPGSKRSPNKNPGKPRKKRTPRPPSAEEEEEDGSADEPIKKEKPVVVAATPAKTPKATEDGSRRVTRGQTSGNPRKRIVISSDEEDSHTPLSKLRGKR